MASAKSCLELQNTTRLGKVLLMGLPPTRSKFMPSCNKGSDSLHPDLTAIVRRNLELGRMKKSDSFLLFLYEPGWKVRTTYVVK